MKGIDYSLVSVEKSKKVNEAAIAEGRCTVLQGSVANMIFAGDWFDAVTAFETVYFWPNLPRCFREVYRVLKPGRDISHLQREQRRYGQGQEVDGDHRRHDHLIRTLKLKAYLEQAGFHDVQIHKKKSWLCITARK